MQYIECKVETSLQTLDPLLFILRRIPLFAQMRNAEKNSNCARNRPLVYFDHLDKFYIRGQFTRHVMYIIDKREYKAEGDDRSE